MRKLLFIISLFILLSASTCQKKVSNEIDSFKMIEYSDTVSKNQLDSIFIADSLSSNIEDDWIQSVTLSGDRKELFYKYAYIKESTDSTALIYMLNTYQDSLYILNKIEVK